MIGFWDEEEGKRSNGRLIASSLVGTAIAIALSEIAYCFFVNSYQPHTALILELAGLGVAGKVSQKYFEKK